MIYALTLLEIMSRAKRSRQTARDLRNGSA